MMLIVSDFFCSHTNCIALKVVCSTMSLTRLSFDYAQQRHLDVFDHYVFEQITVHGTGGQEHRSFGINLFVVICIIEPVVLIRLEAEHRHQVISDVDPVISEGILGEENFDAFVTISVLDLNDEFVIRKIVHYCRRDVGPLYLAYYRVYGIVGSVVEHNCHFGIYA